MDLEKECAALKAYFGSKNIRIDYLEDDEQPDINESDFFARLSNLYKNVVVTHIPTGKTSFGTTHQTQLENTVLALKQLKVDLEK